MKKINIVFAMLLAALALVSCGHKAKETKEAKPKMLVLYYSLTENTTQVADEIVRLTGAAVERIYAAEPYDTSFQATIDRCMKEREAGELPDILPVKADLSQYDVIFVGYPVWFGTYAPPVITFLADHDLSGKTIVPFCTFGSGGLESSTEDLRKAQPDATVLPGYGVRAARLEAMPQEVEEFLKKGGFIEGEYTEPEAFGEVHDVSAEESAVFDQAVDGYPMLHAKAKSVAVRKVQGGTEYQFVAEDLPREGDDRMPPAGELQVYVTALEGAAPVFTRVVR